MGILKSEFTKSDLDTLIEAMGDWEAVGNYDFHALSMVKNMPMPPEDHEAYEGVKAIKEHFLKRENEIKRSREMRHERATFLKTKLMLVKQDFGISKFFEMSIDSSEGESERQEQPIASPPPPSMSNVPPVHSDELKVLKDKLELAEFFIRDLGTWSHYEKFLAERTQEKQE